MKKDSTMSEFEKMERIADVWKSVNSTSHPNVKEHLQNYYMELLDRLEEELKGRREEIGNE